MFVGCTKTSADDRVKKLMRAMPRWSNCNGYLKGFKMMIGLLTVWMLLFFLAFMRYELRVFTIEQRMNVLETMAERGDSNRALALNASCRIKKNSSEATFLQPSVYCSGFKFRARCGV